MPVDPLVLVSDTSTEAERLIACLRARGFRVRDVPLLLLAGRVETQHPGLIVCDGEAPKFIETLRRVRDGAWGKGVDVLILGGATAQLESALGSMVDELPSRQFLRPIDVYSILQSVEERIGSPAARPSAAGGVSMASLPRLQQPPSVPLHDSGHPHISSPVPQARSSGPAASMRIQPQFRFGPAEPSAPPRQAPSHPAPLEDSGPLQSAPQFPVTRVSRELETLLENAELKLGNGNLAAQPGAQAQEHLSPEAELNAILPPDVLAALDEPLDVDEAEEGSSPGTYPGERARLRSNRPSAFFFERDTGASRVGSRPENHGVVPSVSVSPTAHGTLNGGTPAPGSRSSFIPVPSMTAATIQHREPGGFAESLPPATTLQGPPRPELPVEEDTDAPVATLPPQRHRTEAEVSEELTPRPSIDPDDFDLNCAPRRSPRSIAPDVNSRSSRRHRTRAPCHSPAWCASTAGHHGRTRGAPPVARTPRGAAND